MLHHLFTIAVVSVLALFCFPKISQGYDLEWNQTTIKVELEPGENGWFTPDAVVDALRAYGLPRILVEGGADTLANFLDAQAIDLLHVLVAPIILGSGKAGFSLAPIDQLDEAIRPRTTVHLFNDGDVLFTCDLRGGRREGKAA